MNTGKESTWSADQKEVFVAVTDGNMVVLKEVFIGLISYVHT